MLQEVIEEYIAFLLDGKVEQTSERQNTIMAYRNDLRQFCDFLPTLNLQDWSAVTEAHLELYLSEMHDKRTYKPATITRKFSSLKSFFGFMAARKIIPFSPIEDFAPPLAPRDLPQTLSLEQMNQLFDQVECESPAGLRDFAMLHLLYSTGIRPSELVGLNVEHFDADRSILTCPGKHGGSTRNRYLPLPFECFEVIQYYLEQGRPHFLRSTDEQAFFLNHHGERLTRQGFWLIIKGYARRSGVAQLTPHMLRHSFALMMLQDGMSVGAVQKLLGHSRVATTQVYSHLAQSSQQPGA